MCPVDVKYEKKDLFRPALQDVATVLRNGLKSNFEHVEVDVVPCPDLTQQPFTLAKKGLNGAPLLLEIGGPPYLLPLVQRDKIYELKDICKTLERDPVLLVGAGAGSWPYVGVNCEGIYNVGIDNGVVNNHTRISKVDTTSGNALQERLPNNETRLAILGNLFCCEGKEGDVLRVKCRKRTGSNDFIASIRLTLAEKYGDNVVGLGGAFLLQEGKAKQHVMPDFSKTPINSDEELNEWLKFYDMSAPLIAVGTLVTGDLGLDLRVQHFHSFSHHGEAGHYHIDTTPETVEYFGYFNIAEGVVRIDAPQATHQLGRD